MIIIPVTGVAMSDPHDRLRKYIPLAEHNANPPRHSFHTLGIFFVL